MGTNNETPTFPNGFHGWYETFFEISSRIGIELEKEFIKPFIDFRTQHGHMAVVELAKDLTDAFEKEHPHELWLEDDYWETIDKFISEELNKERV